MSKKNPFKEEDTAAYYEKFRPRYHHIPMDWLATQLKDEKIETVLDVACGTGHASLELSKRFAKVIGIDPSPSMLGQIAEKENIICLEGFAEDLPVEDHSADLVNISMGWHWTDPEKFAKELTRVLKPGGYFVAEGAALAKDFSKNEGLLKHFDEFYKKTFPGPPRGSFFPDKDLMKANGFSDVVEHDYAYDFKSDLNQFVGFLMSLSNVAVNAGGRTSEELKAWLDGEFEPFFADGSLDFQMKGGLRFYQLA